MKILSVVCCLFIYLNIADAKNAPATLISKFTIGEIKFSLHNYFPKENTFKSFYTLTATPIAGFGSPNLQSIIAVHDSQGHLLKAKLVVSKDGKSGVMNLKKLSENLYSYFLGDIFTKPCCASGLMFLDNNFKEITYGKFPGPEEGLDFHAFAPSKSNTYFIELSKTRNDDGRTEQIIFEQSLDGKTLFSFNSSQLKSIIPNAPVVNFDINSFDIAKDALFLSLRSTSSVAKISYPQGQELMQISYQTWTFDKDPYNGFRFQHSVQILPNGNLLLFDNGDGFRQRESRAVEYSLDESKKVATLVWSFKKTGLYRIYGGSVRRLKNGNTLINWGNPEVRGISKQNKKFLIWSEVDPKGNLVRELYSNTVVLTYSVDNIDL